MMANGKNKNYQYRLVNIYDEHLFRDQLTVQFSKDGKNWDNLINSWDSREDENTRKVFDAYNQASRENRLFSYCLIILESIEREDGIYFLLMDCSESSDFIRIIRDHSPEYIVCRVIPRKWFWQKDNVKRITQSFDKRHVDEFFQRLINGSIVSIVENPHD